jgi:hypothetical protein
MTRQTDEPDVPIEITVAEEADDRPELVPESRMDVAVLGELYPTARLADGRYVAWWYEADAPDLHDPMTTEWVTAPTRFLAAATLRELWEDPTSFEQVTADGQA